jgi:rhamnosyltransferase
MISDRSIIHFKMDIHTTTPRILVLLAAFNGRKWIEEQINSVLRQRGVQVHLVVGDDASTDNTRELLESYREDRLTIVAHAQRSGSAAQNFFELIRAVDSKEFNFVAFSDQDDIWHENKLSNASRVLQSRGCDLYSSATTAFWADGTSRSLTQNPVVTESDHFFEGAGQGCTYVLTTHFYSRVREFIQERKILTNDLHYHDWALYALARSWQLRWAFDADSAIDYRQHDRNDTGARLSLDGVIRRLNRVASGWYGKQIVGVYRLVAEVNPTDPLITEWGQALPSHRSLSRRFRIARFCIRGGRRKVNDNLMLIGAALLGWI